MVKMILLRLFIRCFSDDFEYLSSKLYELLRLVKVYMLKYIEIQVLNWGKIVKYTKSSEANFKNKNAQICKKYTF